MTSTARRILPGLAALVLSLAAFPGAAAAQRPVTAAVPELHRTDLIAAGGVVVELRAVRSRRGRITVRLEGGGRSVALGPSRTLRLRRGIRRRVRLGFSPAGLRRLADCDLRRIVVFAQPGRAPRTRRKAGVRTMPAEAPRCGRFFGPDAVWNTPLPADAPLDPDSGPITAELVRQVEQEYASGPRPTINASRFSSPVYVVPSDQPRIPVTLERPAGFAPALEEQFAAVPLPEDARPATGSDGHLVVWQPGTETLWEFWQLRRSAEGRWRASWGGRLDRVGTGPGHFTAPVENLGATATGLPLAGGLITPEELAAGSIDHALALALPEIRAGVAAAPAQRSDGSVESASAVPEGARFRLDPALDLEALGLDRVTLAIARAAQRYGMVVRDRSGVVTLYAQDPTPWGGGDASLFGDRTASELLQRFPWRSLALVRMELRSVEAPARVCLGLTCR